jgi:hypothetical protein
VRREERDLFRGKVKDVNRRTTEGFLRGFAEIAGLDSDRGHVFRLEFQNEFAIGALDGDVRAMVPEILTVPRSRSSPSDDA